MSWKTEVNWVLPGTALAQVRDLADHGWPAVTGNGRLVATVAEGDRIEARLTYGPRSRRPAPVLRARLLPDDRGVLVQGHVDRTDLVNLAMWVLFLAVMLAIVLTQAGGSGTALLFGFLLVGGFTAVTPILWGQVSGNQRRAVGDLEAALLERFAVDD